MRRFGYNQVIAAFSASLWLGVSACETGAVGVDSCRDIESARCNAAVHCPSMFKITDPTGCRLYYRDHCLHGLPLSQDPGAGLVNRCVSAINAIGDCAARNSEQTPASECGVLYKTSSTSEVCELIRAPETIVECSFLNPSTATDAGVAATGGAASTGGATSTGGAETTGGATSTGGAAATGGVTSTGASATGGSVVAAG